MPQYEYGCFNCNKTHTAVRSIAKRNAPYSCECGAPCHKLISRTIQGVVIGVHGRIGRDGGWCDSLPGAPIFIKNKGEYREACKRKSKDGAELTPVGLD